jgi:lipopolysaccharide export system ATP-binding protein
MYRRARLGMGYLPQEPSVFLGMTTEDNGIAVLEMNKFTKARIRNRCEESLIGTVRGERVCASL